jgi:hypothetical protein
MHRIKKKKKKKKKKIYIYIYIYKNAITLNSSEKNLHEAGVKLKPLDLRP